LQASLAGEDDHHVLAEGLSLFLLSLPQPLARRHHHDDGDDSPGDAEHGERCPQLVREQRVNGVFNEVAKAQG